jgi:hypothetical protein
VSLNREEIAQTLAAMVEELDNQQGNCHDCMVAAETIHTLMTSPQSYLIVGQLHQLSEQIAALRASIGPIIDAVAELGSN